MDRVELEWFLMAVDMFNVLYVDILIVVDAFSLWYICRSFHSHGRFNRICSWLMVSGPGSFRYCNWCMVW